MRDVIRRYVHIFSNSVNATSSPARGVVCDVDMGDASPIAQKARKVHPQYLKKLHVLLKTLLQNGLTGFRLSNGPH